MKSLFLAAACLAIGFAVSVDLSGQLASPKQTDAVKAGPRTSWGDPDISGLFTTDDELGVPFERPAQFGDRQFVTAEEFAQRQQQSERQDEADREAFVAPLVANRPAVQSRAARVRRRTGSNAESRRAAPPSSSIHRTAAFRS